MPDRLLDLRLFRYALTSAEHGSFRRAAARVRSLEDRVKAKLFERDHSGFACRITFSGKSNQPLTAVPYPKSTASENFTHD